MAVGERHAVGREDALAERGGDMAVHLGVARLADRLVSASCQVFGAVIIREPRAPPHFATFGLLTSHLTVIARRLSDAVRLSEGPLPPA
jgi:hypothetical protein